MMEPLVSVVVATYRREQSLMKALKSVSVQSYRKFEIILVDDNDDPQWNEKVRTIVQTFTQSNDGVKIKVIENHPNQGSARTRNIGIAAADGELITFLDDDDLFLPDKILRQATFMAEGGFDYCITDLDLYNENEKLVERRTRNYIKETTKDALQRYHLIHHLTGTDTMMFRKAYLMQIGCFAPIDVGDEYYLMQRAIDGEGRFGYLPGSDVKAYVHTGEAGLSSGESKIKGENALYSYKKQYFDGISAKDRRYIRMRHYAVIAFAQMRRHKYCSFFVNAAASFFCSPLQCATMLLKRSRL